MKDYGIQLVSNPAGNKTIYQTRVLIVIVSNFSNLLVSASLRVVRQARTLHN